MKITLFLISFVCLICVQSCSLFFNETWKHVHLDKKIEAPYSNIYSKGYKLGEKTTVSVGQEIFSYKWFIASPEFGLYAVPNKDVTATIDYRGDKFTFQYKKGTKY